MTLGYRLRKLRKEMKLSQQKLAEMAGVVQPTISDYERDVTQKHRADELMRIAAVLGTTPEWLKTGKGPEKLADATSDKDVLIEAFDKMDTNSRAALIAAAKAMAFPIK
jgi:transcriptional regulator with XRE-family HTH domain